MDNDKQEFWKSLQMPSVRNCNNCKWQFVSKIIYVDGDPDPSDICGDCSYSENYTTYYFNRWEWDEGKDPK